jgi:hypothetical protein
MVFGKFAHTLKLAPAILAAVSLSACVTTGGTGSTAADTPNAVGTTAVASAQPVNPAPTSSGSMIEVQPTTYSAGGTPHACVGDLRFYRAYLQMPDAAHAVDMNKPINDYVREAGGADAAINAANAQVIQLRQQLNTALADRDPFDEDSRKDSDDAIATLEDNILLNQALAEALQCRRNI